MSDTTKRAKLSVQLTMEQELRLKALGKWKRRGVCERLRVALDGVLTDLEIERDEKPAS